MRLAYDHMQPVYETRLCLVVRGMVARCQRGHRHPPGGTVWVQVSCSGDPGAELVYCTVPTQLPARAGRSILSHLG
ncbi:hypothetical protein V8C42DRAFT_19271 [Trichoderma barbatum]